MGGRGGGGAFSPLTVALLLAIGILGFVGTLVLGAFAPDLATGRNGGAHALSNAAVGYAGLVRLAEETGREPAVIRDEELLGTEDLVVFTPEDPKVDLSERLRRRAAKPTLIVLPKWSTAADPVRSGWMRVAGLLDEDAPEGILAPDYRLEVSRRRSGGRPLRAVRDLPNDIRFRAPRPVQVIADKDLEPLIVDERGGIVLGHVRARDLYVLADPDLLSNAGVADLSQARSALALLDFINGANADGIAFDVTANGLGATASPLRLAFEPPFLAFTLCLFAALVLARWQAGTRFGAARAPARAIAFGKRALVDNSAMLVRKAGREAALGGRYADALRERALRAFAAPARLRAEEADAWLDRAGGRRRFTDLAAAVRAAGDRTELLRAASALHAWLGGKLK